MKRKENTKINNLHAKGICVGKTLYGNYFDAVRNIGVYLTIFVVRKVWVSTIHPFQAILLITLHIEVKGKSRSI